MTQLGALLYKNLLMLKGSKLDSVLTLSFCALLPLMVLLIPFDEFQRVSPATNRTYSFNDGTQYNMKFLVWPNTTEVADIMQNVERMLNASRVKANISYYDDQVVMASKLKSRVDYEYDPTDNYYSYWILIGVEFSNLTGPDFVYYLRPNGDGVPSANLIFTTGESYQCILGPCPYTYMLPIGGYFSTAQQAIDQALISKVSGKNSTEVINAKPAEFPTKSSIYMQTTAQIMILVIPLTFYVLLLLRFIVTKMVEEKEFSMKQLMVVMGMKMHSFVLSWFIIFSVVLVFLSGITTLIMMGSYISSSIVSLFFLTLVHSLNIFALGFVISTLFTTTKSANLFSNLVSLVCVGIYLIVGLTTQVGHPFEYEVPMAVVYILMIFPTFTYSLSIQLMYFAEVYRDGVDGDAFFTLGQIPAVWLMVVLVVSFFAYMALGFALERLLSPEYGDRPSWLCFSSSKVSDWQDTRAKYPDEDFEGADVGWNSMIRINDVWKVFQPPRHETVVAVRGITFDIYDSQITCILGHNGAGKSTLLGMMTRLLRPTAGTITFSDPRVQDDGSIGVCLQSNTHYKGLTVREHLKILSRLKRVENSDIAIAKVLDEVGLQDSADKNAANLSGGQKRRLNVAIALIGDPKVIFLDEPTSGVDPLSRRAIWQILQSRKAKHCIILTTHYMDEADILADRKAIVSQGTLRCAGSSLFLKNRFGAGYHLNVELQSTLGTTAVAKSKQQLQQLVYSCVPDAKLRDETQTTVSITLPFTSVQSFPQLFKQLDAPATKRGSGTVAQMMGVRTYGIELTTLEEVFLKLASERARAAAYQAFEHERSKHKKDYERIETYVNSAYLGSPTDSTSSIATESESAKLQRLQNLLNNSKQLSGFGKWLAMLQLRFHMTIGAWLGTLSAVVTSPLILFATVIIFASIMSSINLGNNTTRLIFDPLLYVAPANGQSTLPPLIFENGTNNNSTITASDFQRVMNTLKVEVREVDDLTYDYYVGIRLNDKNPLVWFSDLAYHSVPVVLTILSNFFIKTVDPKYSITTISAPIGTSSQPLAANDSANDGFTSISYSIPGETMILFMPIGIAVILTVSAARLHTEFTCGAFNQLRCTGVSGITYWSVQLIIDSGMYILAVGLSLLAILVGPLLFSITVQYTVKLSCDILVLALYMPVSLLLLYIIILLFRNYSVALVCVLVVLMFAIIPYIFWMILAMLVNISTTPFAFPPVFYAFLCFPNALLLNAVASLNYVTKINGEKPLEFSDYFKPENQFVWSFLAGGIHIVTELVLVLLIHKSIAEKHSPLFGSPNNSRKKKTPATNVDVQVNMRERDSDVYAEESYISNLLKNSASNNRLNTHDSPTLVCHDLTLNYEPGCCTGRCCSKEPRVTKTAVNSLTMSVANSQVFGLLGQNGAGKTSTLKIITGAERADYGTIYLGGKRVASMPLAQLFDKVSVCTQDDALWMMLTVRNHLHYYARLRGYQGETRTQLVNTLIDLLEIKAHADKRCGQLSGGTKRKVMFAISMIKTNRISLVLCDEPTSGLDPQSKRVLWNLLTGLFRDRGGSQSECACIFTSHSMEEVEAVCDRIGIMINGQLHCLGTIQHCKDKFGNAYSIELKLKSTNNVGNLWAHLQSKFPLANQVDTYVNSSSIFVNIPRGDVKFGYLFEVLEEAKQSEVYEIEEYSVGQCTLEQVFLDLVKKHT